MKVLLISANNEREPYPVAPIGVAYIARALRDNGHTVSILDLCFVDDNFSAIAESIKDIIPDVIGISIRNIDNLTYNKSQFYLPEIKRIVDFIKNQGAFPMVVGGSGFSIFPEEVLRYLELEIGIVGEGETAFSMYLESIDNGSDLSNIPNLCYIRDGRFWINSIQRGNFNLLPDRSLLHNRDYLELGGMANIQSKRGCPFRCSYCTYPGIDGKRLRLREPEDVVEELSIMVYKYGIDYVFFVDDIFNYPLEHAISICEEILRRNMKIEWTCFATPMGMTLDLARLMKRSGCKGVEFGSDAGSNKTLKGLNKSFTTNEIAFAVECCNSVELPNAHYILIGGPEEEYRTVDETFSFFEKVEPTAVIALIGIRIYPNTLLFKRAIEEDVISEEREMLLPVFYITSEVALDVLSEKVTVYAERNKNWIVPGLNIRCDTTFLQTLRRMGKRGPLWNMLK